MSDVSAAFRHFKKYDPVLYTAGLPHRKALSLGTHRRGKMTLFAALASSVVSQQLATKAADSIWARLKEILGGKVTPEAVLAASGARLRRAGLSSAKAKTLKELAKAIKRGLSLPSLRSRTKVEATEILTAVWGIGPWTTEMFLMFALGHPDIFSARDLGLVRSMETLYALKNPSLEKLEKMALVWSPYRSLACRILWRARDSI